jgi:hypothetical protein
MVPRRLEGMLWPLICPSRHILARDRELIRM